MLGSLPMPVSDPLLDYDRAIGGRNTEREVSLRQARNSVIEAYSNYRSDLGATGLSPISLSESAKIFLKSSYDLTYSPRRLNDLRGSVLATTNAIHGKCPLCGISRASAIDHYLPKSLYPEFSIYVFNLIPICPRCNGLKSDRCQNNSPDEFFHVYLDLVPNYPLLRASIQTNPDLKIRYEVNPPRSESDYLSIAFARQFEILELEGHFVDEAIGELFGQYDVFLSVFDREGSRGLTELVRSISRTSERVWGHNYWRTALYVGLMRSLEFSNGGFECLKPRNQ